MEQGTNLKNEDESISNNGETLSKNLSLQASLTDVGEKILLENNVGDEHSSGNDNTITDDSINNNASNAEDELSSEISDDDKQVHTANLEGRRNDNSTVGAKGAEKILKREKSSDDISISHYVDQPELSNQSENYFTNVVIKDEKKYLNISNISKVMRDQENLDQETENDENRKDLSEFFGNNNDSTLPEHQTVIRPKSRNTEYTLDYDNQKHTSELFSTAGSADFEQGPSTNLGNLSASSRKFHNFEDDTKSDNDITNKRSRKSDTIYDDNIGYFQDKEDDFNDNSGYDRINKKKEVESYYNEQGNEYSNQESDYDTKNQKKLETSDEDEDNDENVDYDDNYDDSYEEGDFRSSEYNRTDKKEEDKSYYRKQISDEDDDNDENVDYDDNYDDNYEEKDNIRSSEYSRIDKKEEDEPYYRRQISDEDDDNDDNVDYDENIGEFSDDHKEEDYRSSRYNRVDKKKEDKSNYRRQKDEHLDEEFENPVSKSGTRDQKKLVTSDEEGDNDENVVYDDNIGLFQDKNDDYKDGNYRSSKYNRVDKEKEIEPNYRRQRNEDLSEDLENPISKSSYDNKGKQELKISDEGGNNDYYNKNLKDYNKRDSSGSNRINTKNETVPYYRRQEDETTRQGSVYGFSSNEEVEKPISKHGYGTGNQKKSKMTDDNGGNVDYDDNFNEHSKYNHNNGKKDYNSGSKYENRNNNNNNRGKDQNSNVESHSSSYGWSGVTNVTNMIKGFIPGSNRNDKELRVIFHVHFPEGIEQVGKPAILGNIKELGNWKNPIVKLRRKNKTYWRSDPVFISLSSPTDEIKYKYAVLSYKTSYIGRKEEKLEFEGDNPLDNRTLNIGANGANNQFDIWINNYQYRIHTIHFRDFAFVECVYDSIETDNLKEKVMEFQHLLTLHKDLTIHSSNLDFIYNRINRINNESNRGKQLFLCLLLGYYISRRQSWYYNELQNDFPSGLLLSALEDYKQKMLPSNAVNQMYIAIITLIQHNAFLMKFDWVIIFTIAAEVDPNYTFIDRLRTLKYSDNNLGKFIKAIGFIRPYIAGIQSESYVKIAKWLIQLFQNMDFLFNLWENILLHNNDELDERIFKCFIDRIRECISYYNAVALELHYKRVPNNYRNDVSIVFQEHILFLLEDSNKKWTKENIAAVINLLREDSLNWHKEEVMQSLELISQSNTLELLDTFPELLDNWFRSDFSDSRKNKIPKICETWFQNLLLKIDTKTSTNKKESAIVFSVFSQLDRISPLLCHRKNIWQSLTALALERVRICSESQIFSTTKFLNQIEEKDVKILFLNMIKEMLNKIVQQANDQLKNKIFTICDCKGKTLQVSNSMSEEILFHIMDRLQSQLSSSNPSEYHLNILESSQFWIIILRATGSVNKLRSHPFVERVKTSINKLGGLLRERKIDVQLLQQVLAHPDEKIFQHLDAALPIKRGISDVIVSRDEIAELRRLCNNFQIQLDVLFKFYTEFCSGSKVTDVDDYIQDLKQHMPNSNKVTLKEVLLTSYWEFHVNTLESAKLCYKYNQSRSFRNIFEACIHEDAAATKVEYIAKKLVPAVFERWSTICKQFKEWEKLKRSDATLFWKNVTDVNAELDFMESYKGIKNAKFVQTLNHLSKISHWIERLKELETVVNLFGVTHTEEDWLKKSIRNLEDDSMKLNQINSFFDYLDRNLNNVTQQCWKLIKELSGAEDFISFLNEIADHDIKNLINGVDDHSDERLIQEDTVSSLIQVKQFLLPLMNKNKAGNISGFLDSLSSIIKRNSTIGEKIALCNSCHMALRNMYKNIADRGEVTKEKIKNAVFNGTYTVRRDEKDDKCFVSLKYVSKTSKSEVVMTYDMNEILDLRGRALLVAKPKISEGDEKDEEISKNIVDEFVTQVDIAQEIINVVSILTQLGHFDYRKFENELQGTDQMKGYFEYLKSELIKWQDIVDRAQEKCYYLTFYPARHILAFYDYFTSEKLDEENEEECKTLIRFVNSKTQLPSRKDVQGISRGIKDYFKILCEIGNELERIFSNVSKQSRRLKAAGQRIMSDVVKKGKLFIAACANNTQVPNVIMSLYANHGYYPEPWQLLICTPSTTMEELTIFLKRSFFASNNGYENHLFCIANLELLDFELQYDLVNQIRSMRDQKDYLLALICCKESVMHHHILDQFASDVHATKGLNNDSMRGIYRELCQNVVRVSSDLSGQGKTEWIKEDSFNKKKIPRSFLISDDMEFSRLVRQFKECRLRPVESLHINIVSANYPGDVNMFLFELLTLGMVSTNIDIACLPPSETPTYIFIEIASTMEQHLLNSLPMAGYLLHNHLTWNIKSLKVSQEIVSPIQITCNYLNLLDRNEINTKEILFRTDKAIKDSLPPERCQNLVEKYFFNQNNKDISSFRFVEIFVNVLADQLVRFSSSQFFTVDNLRLMVKENDIRNLILRTLMDGSKDFATRSIRTKEAQLESIESITADDENARLGTIVQWDDSNHLIVFFNSQAPDTISALYRDRTKVHENVKTLLKSQIIGDKTKWELDDYNMMSADALFTKLEFLARRSTEKLDLPEYALSGDNLIKMALILLRARANIPVIVCGEAGCGKTSLIAYLALMVEVQFQALNLHAGIDEKTIMMFMNDSLEKAEKGEIWLFFDEINTCNHIGLLSDLISHRMFNGKQIHPNIRLFSACNPYRLRNKAQSEAGLTNKVKRYEEQSKLVYQVKPLPDQILDYVWDYGILKPKDEYKYIQIMVEKELKNLAHPVFSELLFASQKFIRKVEEPYSVSLRDVKRAITLVKFFYTSLQNRPAYRKGHVYPPPSGNPTTITRSYVLALSLCYHSRLYDQELRGKYRYEMVKILQNHKCFVGEHLFAMIVRDEQEDYINRMQCPPNTAHNEALLENVLIMIVCILTRIPLFLIGAPGSSKSLAVRLISSNLRGSDSNDKYFRKLPQIYLIPHQGSSSSTSDGIIKVFDKANKYQETTSKQYPVISVVLLDEVGLAETSPFNPLKVLHSLLEPSYPATGPTVSVIGISNWRLDNSKSSRALLVQRPQFCLDDLVDTAKRLLNTRISRSGQSGALVPLANAYSDYEKNGQSLPNFHGLRDYYALVKRLSLNEMTPKNIQMALARNFGGTENHVKLCKDYFGNVIKMFNNHKPWSYKQIPIEHLIESNLDDPDARHLMVIGKSDSVVNLLTYQLKRKKLEPVVILGSQFPDDKEDYSYSVLRRIMMCVEAGRPLILTDLEMIYGSLYDLWNQNYIVVGSKDNIKYFTRVALGAYANPMLYVSPNFKCILVMDENNLARADPPLLNRFEKQKMSINDTLNDRQKLLVANLRDWARKMSTLIGADKVTQSRNKFTLKDLFIGFDENETLQSLVIDITKNNSDAEDDEILENCKECLIATASSDGIVRADRSGLEREEIELWKQVYFHRQHHDSLYDYFSKENLLVDSNGHLVIVNTFSNINTDVRSCLQEIVSCQVDKLSIFKTEAQLSNRIKHFWSESTDQMLILQCDVTTVGVGCIKLAKFIIEQFRDEFISKREQGIPMKHACIILHLHRDQTTFTSFNFMCGWKQTTIETLSRNDIPTSGLLEGSLSDIIDTAYPFEKILLQELLWCLSCMRYASNEKSINHIRMLSEKILKCPRFVKCLKERILELIEGKSEIDWQYKVASNKQNLYPYPSFSIALQAHIRTLIRKPIAQILCALERLSATKTFFYVEDQTKSKKNYVRLVEFWEQVYMDKKIIKTEDLMSPKPDGYNMPEGSLLDLEFPFSFYFVKRIDNFKKHYEEEIAILQKDDDRIDPETNELHDYVIEEHLKDFKNNLFTSIPHLRNSPLDWASELYLNDFVTIIGAKENKNKKLLSLFLKLLLGADKVCQPIFLHAYWWKNSNEVLALLQLAQMSQIIIKNIEAKGNAVIRGGLEKRVVKELTKSMLQKVCGNFEGAADDHLIDKWQHDVTKVLSLSNKIKRTKNLPDLQLLRIVNDLVATKTIPLDSIREIVQLGLRSDEQEVLSEEFVNSVLDKLDKLEQNEKNAIPRRSFIMRCLTLIPIESDVRLNFYEKLFSKEPFPLMGAIIERIFLKEDKENEDIFITLITDGEEALVQSARLNNINNCLRDLDSNMATLCCDVIEQTFFMNEEYEDLEKLAPYFGTAVESLYRQGRPSLQKITSIALLKEFVRRFWDSFLQEDKISPIEYNRMEEENFSDELVNQVNNLMTFDHPMIRSLKFYFLRDLCRRDFSLDDVRRFCEAQKNTLPWLKSLNWEDIKENRLSFNPYCILPEYNEAENSFMNFYSIGNKTPFHTFIQNIKQNLTLTAKMSLMGLFFVRLHALRASREWRHSETSSSNFLTEVLAEINLSNLFKTIAKNILLNRQPLLQINDSGINNTDLFIKSIIAHIIAFHASVEPNSSQLSMYLHQLQDCQNLFILSCASDIESVIVNAVAETERSNTNKLRRYACKCGYKYFIADCGKAATTGRCPECGNTIGGSNHVSAAGNTPLDDKPVAQISVNDQAGYVGELISQNIYESVRYLSPTAYRIIHLIVHVLIGANAPQIAIGFLQKNDQTATNSEKYCMDHIRNDWEILKKLLNCSDGNLALMFHSLISSMMEKPLPTQQLKTPAEREKWEADFYNNYIAAQIKNVTETATNYRMKLSEALARNQKGNLIEGEINQTLVMDKKYCSENLPNLWRTIGIINFNSFRAYYMSDLSRKNDYPFLSIFFKYSEQLELIKHLLPIVKFVQILNSKLGYQLSRQTARDMDFRRFIEKESNGVDNEEIDNNLRTAFENFAYSWNTVLPLVKRYQCHELPNDKPIMDYNLPVEFGLVEQKDSGIYLCAILYHLINIQNRFLQEVIEIPSGTCRSLKFLDELNIYGGSSTSKTKSNTPNGYCLQSMYLDQARSGSIINFEWDDEILAYSQRNLGIARGEDVVYDLTKIEMELANILVFEKVFIETQPDSQLYLETFPYHMELFQGCMRILSDIKNLITQEPIPIEKMDLLGISKNFNSFTYPQREPILDNASEILSSLEILLCFVKRTAAGDGEKSIKSYVLQWMKLSSLYENERFSKILDNDLRLKHLVSLYELVEEQVANVKVKYINEKYREPLSPDMENVILQSVDFEQQNIMTKLPAEDFALALKRYMLRFLTVESHKETDQLCFYLRETSLNFWPSSVPEDLIEKLFPENLLVANTYDAYCFVMSKIEETKKKLANIIKSKPTTNPPFNQPLNQSFNPQMKPTTNKGKKSKKHGGSKYDVY